MPVFNVPSSVRPNVTTGPSPIVAHAVDELTRLLEGLGV